MQGNNSEEELQNKGSFSFFVFNQEVCSNKSVERF